MWFKTRVGFASVTPPFEILCSKHNAEPTWFIFASMKTGPEMTMKSLFGRRAAVSPPVLYLAFFRDGPDVGAAIAECMAEIETAIRAKADFCDLSQAGDAEAWGKAWQQVQWPRAGDDGASQC